MDMAPRSVGDAGLGQKAIRHARIEAPLVVAIDAPAEQFGGVGNDDRRGLDRADHDAGGRCTRVDQDRGQRMRKFTRLAAALDIAPMRR